MGIQEGIVIIRGNFERARKNFIEVMYRVIDYVRPGSLDGTYMEPQIVVPTSVMAKTAETTPAEELAKRFGKGYQVEPIQIDEKAIIFRSGLEYAQKIEKRVKRFGKRYESSLDTEVREIVPSERTEIDWDNFSKVTT